MQSGKTTLAKILKNNHGFKIISFAGPLKAMFESLLEAQGIDPETRRRMVYGDLKETPAKSLMMQTPRHAMQTLGTEWGRECIHPNIWTMTAALKACDLMAEGHDVVFDDMRFPNEAEALIAIGGLTVQVVRENGRSLDQGHPSEGALAGFTGWHKTIYNNSSVDDLMYEADRLVKSLR